VDGALTGASGNLPNGWRLNCCNENLNKLITNKCSAEEKMDNEEIYKRLISDYECEGYRMREWIKTLDQLAEIWSLSKIKQIWIETERSIEGKPVAAFNNRIKNESSGSQFEPLVRRFGVGKRGEPACFAYHKEFRYVPVIRFEENVIIWDDNQISRSYPTNDVFEIAQYSEFDLEKPLYAKNA
jgi:hypothetical protein